LKDTADNLRVETQQGVIHIDNSAGRYTRGGHSRDSKVEDTAWSYEHREHSKKLFTRRVGRTQQKIIKMGNKRGN
jgi:hypothetical protein